MPGYGNRRVFLLAEIFVWTTRSKGAWGIRLAWWRSGPWFSWLLPSLPLVLCTYVLAYAGLFKTLTPPTRKGREILGPNRRVSLIVDLKQKRLRKFGCQKLQCGNFRAMLFLTSANREGYERNKRSKRSVYRLPSLPVRCLAYAEYISGVLKTRNYVIE